MIKYDIQIIVSIIIEPITIGPGSACPCLISLYFQVDISRFP